MPEYILLLHEEPAAFSGLSPTDIQAMIQRYKGWRESIAAKGHQAGGKKLRDAVGRVMKTNNGKIVSFGIVGLVLDVVATVMFLFIAPASLYRLGSAKRSDSPLPLFTPVEFFCSSFF